jgi:hypothetical protein
MQKGRDLVAALGGECALNLQNHIRRCAHTAGAATQKPVAVGKEEELAGRLLHLEV